MTDPLEIAFYREMGMRIRDVRGSVRQEDLARALGMTRTSMVNIEAGRQRLLVHDLLQIAKTLGISTAELLSPFEHELPAPGWIPIQGISDKTKEASRWVGIALAKVNQSEPTT